MSARMAASAARHGVPHGLAREPPARRIEACQESPERSRRLGFLQFGSAHEFMLN